MKDTDRAQEELGIALDPERIPQHIAIIMDGNGRWATNRGLPRPMGHIQGYETVNRIVRACDDLGVKALTLYTFSTENWRRPAEETGAIMSLIETATREQLSDMMANNVRMKVSGDFDGLPKDVRTALAESIETTAKNTGLVLNLAINYGGRAEILHAVRSACKSGIDPDAITEEYFSSLLYTAGLPDPDLLIRTAGELRVSNFLLWQIAYAEIWVTETLWPDFTERDLVLGIADYQKRLRKFGAAPEDVE